MRFQLHTQGVFRRTLLGASIVLATSALTAKDLDWRRPEAARANTRSAAKASAGSAKLKPSTSAVESRPANPDGDDSPTALRAAATRDSKPITRTSSAADGGVARNPFGDEGGYGAAQVSTQSPSAPRRANRQVAYNGPAYTPPWHPHPLYSRHQAAYPGPPARGGQYWQQGRSPGPNGYFVSTPDEAEVVPPGLSIEPEPVGDDPLGRWGGDCGGCGSCDACGTGGYGPYSPWSSIFHTSIMLGVQGFKGPVDNGVNGSFGFSEGFNISAPLPLFDCRSYCHTVGMQFGMRFVQSNLNGHVADSNFHDDPREQVFMTAGLFKRADEHSPWQYGLVYDQMVDDYYYQADIGQLRMEVSRFGWCGNEVGIMAAFRIGEDDAVPSLRGDQPFTLGPNDYYTVFLRRALLCDGEWRVYAGPSGEGDGLMGAEFWLPVNDSVALEGGVTYVFAEEGQPTAQQEDSYSIGLNLVWYPCRRARCAAGSPFRPLIGVASNGTFLSERR
ncbi:MAG: DUF6666 family protein [Pirellulales bacterium]